MVWPSLPFAHGWRVPHFLRLSADDKAHICLKAVGRWPADPELAKFVPTAVPDASQLQVPLP